MARRGLCDVEKIMEVLRDRLRWDDMTGRFSSSVAVDAAALTPDAETALRGAGVFLAGDFASLSVGGDAALEAVTGVAPFDSAFASVRRDDGDHLALDRALAFLSAAGMMIDVVSGGGVGSDRIPARGAVRSVMSGGGFPALMAAIARSRGRFPGVHCVLIMSGLRLHGEVFDLEITSGGSVVTMTARPRDVTLGHPSGGFDREAVKAADSRPLEEIAGSEDHDVLHAMAMSHDMARRLVAAKSPWSAPETLESLVADESLEVRDAALENPAMPQRAIWKAAHDPRHEKSRVAAASRPDLPVEIARVLVEDASPSVRASLAANKSLRWEDVSPLIDDADEEVLRRLLARRDAPSEAILAAAADLGGRARLVLHRDDVPLAAVEAVMSAPPGPAFDMMVEALARRRSLPAAMVRWAAGHDSSVVRRAVLETLPDYADTSAVADMVDRFAVDRSDAVRLDLVRMRGRLRPLLGERLVALAETQARDQDRGVREALAASNEALPRGVLERLAGDGSTDVLLALLERSDLDQSILLIVTENASKSREDPELFAAVERRTSEALFRKVASGEADSASVMRSMGVPGKIAARLLSESLRGGLDASWLSDVAPIARGMARRISDVDLVNAVNTIITRAAESGAMKDAVATVARSGHGEMFGTVMAILPPQKRLRVVEGSGGLDGQGVGDICRMFFGTRDARGGVAKLEDGRAWDEAVMEFVRDATGKEIAGLAAFHKFLSDLSKKINQPNLRLAPQRFHDVREFEGVEIESREFGTLRVSFPKTAHELVDWGEALGMCVGCGSYARSAASGDIMLVGLKTADKGRMVGMVECKMPSLSIAQARGQANKELPDGVVAEIRGMLRRLARTTPARPKDEARAS